MLRENEVVELTPGLTLPTQTRVRYGETDQMGVVYHGKYIEYMELGRTDFMRAIGYTYRRMEDEGHFFVVVEMNAKLHAPARYDDLITVWTSVTKLRPSSLVFSYELRLDDDDRNSASNGEGPAERDGVVLATGSTRLASLNAATRKVQPIPEVFAQMIRRCLPQATS